MTVIKFLAFFLVWAVLAAVLPLSSSKVPALWRLWAEIMPLLAMIGVTLFFWLIVEKKQVKLYFFDNPAKGAVVGLVTGIFWLAVPVFIMYAAKIIHFEGKNEISLFAVWVLAAFLNVIMQELLVRGYLYQMIKQKHNMIAAAVSTTALFTGLHGGAVEEGIVPVCSVMTMSLLMTIVLEYTGSIIAPIIMHFLWNGIGALVLGGVSLADDYPNLLIASFSGNEFLSGGACKMEGSGIVLFVNIILIAFFVFLKRKEDKEV